MNEVLKSLRTPVKPEVGIGCTVLGFSDRHPGTIIEVNKSGKRIKVQMDHYKLKPDSHAMSENQDYDIWPNPEGSIKEFSLRKNGSWKAVNNGYGILHIGYRSRYYDPCF